MDFSDVCIDRRFSLDSPPGPKATLIPRDAKAGVLHRAYLPAKGQLNLDGFVFAAFDSPHALAFQKDWLLRQTNPASSQPYEQVATVLRAMGLDDQAREILVTKNEEQGQKDQEWTGFLWYRVVGPFIRYGYGPWSAFYLSIFLIAVGTVLFGLGKRFDLITPTKEEAYADKNIERGKLTEFYPTFNAFIFSLETFVPLLHLNISDHWAPNPNRRKVFPHLTLAGRILRVYLWFHIIVGFVLTTLWIGGLAGLIKT